MSMRAEVKMQEGKAGGGMTFWDSRASTWPRNIKVPIIIVKPRHWNLEERVGTRQVTTPSIIFWTMAWKQWSANALLASLYATQALASEPEVFTKSSNESLQWGPYRSNLYFGVRPRIPKSLSASLSWVRVEDFQKVQNNVRLTCEQHEGMAGYGWDSYDPRTGGVQTIHDKGNGIDLETSFVTISDGAWAARIKGTPREDAELMAGTQNGVDTIKTALWFNLGLEGLGSLEATGVEDAEEYGYQGDVVFDGQTNDLGEFTVTVTEPDTNSHPDPIHPAGQTKPLDRTLVHSLQVPEEASWQIKREYYEVYGSIFRAELELISLCSYAVRINENNHRWLRRRIHCREDAAAMADLHDPEPPWCWQHASGSEGLRRCIRIRHHLQAEEPRDVLFFRLRDQADRQRQEEL